MLDTIFEFLTSDSLSLWGPFLLLLLCGLGLPIPEDIVLITAGAIGAENSVALVKTMTLMYVGIILGDGIVYFAGRKIGYRLLNTKIARILIHPEKFGKVQALFAKWGNWVVFIGRFLPGLRTPIFFTAGTLKYSSFRFFTMDGLAALLSAPFFVYLGHWAWIKFGEDFEKVQNTLGHTKLLFLIVVIIGVPVGLYVLLKKNKTPTSHSESN